MRYDRRIDAVIFDQGKVLDDYGPQTLEIARELGITPELYAKLAAPHVPKIHLGEMDEIELYDIICKSAGMEPPKESLFKKTFKTHRPLNYELLGVAEQLRTFGIKTGILSNAEIVLSDILRNMYGTADPKLFDDIVCSCDPDIKTRKPKDELFLKACERLGVPIARTAFVDDIQDYADRFTQLGGHGIHYIVNENKINEKAIRELSRLAGHNLVLRPYSGKLKFD